MINIFKTISSKLPKSYQQELKRILFSRQIRMRTFKSEEKEYYLLDRWVKKGDWVIDIGANVGHYTIKLSDIVGKTGRVIAFEPIPETFELLAANTARLSFKNVTLLNVGASSSTCLHGMALPKFDTGLDNYYMAQITTDNPSIEILCLSVDSLNLSNPVGLIKIDAEGHDLQVLKGMESLLERDHPVLIIEEGSSEIQEYLNRFGYIFERINGSHNRVFYIKRAV